MRISSASSKFQFLPSSALDGYGGSKWDLHPEYEGGSFGLDGHTGKMGGIEQHIGYRLERVLV